MTLYSSFYCFRHFWGKNFLLETSEEEFFIFSFPCTLLETSGDDDDDKLMKVIMPGWLGFRALEHFIRTSGRISGLEGKRKFDLLCSLSYKTATNLVLQTHDEKGNLNF